MFKFFAVHLAVILRDKVEFIRWRERGLDNLERTVVVRNQGIITSNCVMVNRGWPLLNKLVLVTIFLNPPLNWSHFFVLTSSWLQLTQIESRDCGIVTCFMFIYCGSIDLYQQSVCLLNWIWTWMTSWYQRQMIWPRNLIRENCSLVNMLTTVLIIEQINGLMKSVDSF